MEFSSKLLENAVNEMSRLPGIGKRTALRLVLHLLKQPKDQTEFLSQALNTMRSEINFCDNCHNISDTAICEICSNPKRNKSIICIVEDVRDVMAIENTGKYRGKYLVLGGKISPMEGIGPHQLHISSIGKKLESGEITPNGFGIGLLNIHSRIQLLFGDAYGLSFSNSDNIATVEILVPLSGH